MKHKTEYFYFIGIGGIGMSALASYLNAKGKKIAGYDLRATDITKRLQSAGIIIQHMDDPDLIPFSHRDPEETTVVYTPAIADKHGILRYFREHGFACVKRAEILGELSNQFRTIAIAGTHGKTTISTMVAFLLHRSGIKVNAFLGGISRDFGTNILLDEQAEWMVTEADEFDRSFLQLYPEKLVITSMDADHLDVYENREQLVETYALLLAHIPENGLALLSLQVQKEIDKNKKLSAKIETYHLSEEADCKAENIRVENGHLFFDFSSSQIKIKDLQCGLPGLHNVENALAAIRIALEFDLSPRQIRDAMAEFQGVKRRFDVHIKSEKFIYIDDYAHHPTEITTLINSVKMLYPKREITVIFQPHLYSRTRDFGDEFAEALALADELILLEIYPAREEPIEGIKSLWLAKKIKKENVPVCQKHQLINILKQRNPEVLLTVGAGDIDEIVEPIVNHLTSRL